MTDYGMPTTAVDTTALDRAYTEETVRRAKDLADDIYADTDDPRAKELCSALWRLGIHLDHREAS